jgi:hypothetical protein
MAKGYAKMMAYSYNQLMYGEVPDAVVNYTVFEKGTITGGTQFDFGRYLTKSRQGYALQGKYAGYHLQMVEDPYSKKKIPAQDPKTSTK